LRTRHLLPSPPHQIPKPRNSSYLFCHVVYMIPERGAVGTWSRVALQSWSAGHLRHRAAGDRCAKARL